MACPSYGEGTAVYDQIALLNMRASSWEGNANSAIDAAIGSLNNVHGTNPDNFAFEIDWGSLPDGFNEFHMPDDPVVPDLSYTEPGSPNQQPISSITPPVAYTMPAYDVVRPTLDLSGTPGPAPDITVSAVPAVVPPTVGAPPTIVAPAAPMAVSVDSIGTLPERSAPEWTGARPSLDTSGVPGAAPTLDVGAVPDVSRPVLGSAPVPVEPGAPMSVTLPTIEALPTRTAPTWTTDRPTLDLSGAPGALAGSQVGDVPAMVAPTLTAAPAVVEPASPRDVPTPSVPALSERVTPVWTGVRPALDLSGAPGAAPVLEVGALETFTTPSAGAVPVPVEPGVPLAVEIGTVDALPARTAPAWDTARPDLDLSGAPGAAPGLDIAAPPTLLAPTVPTAPTLTVPGLPRAIPTADVPDIPTRTAPVWTAERPTLDISGQPGPTPESTLPGLPSLVVPTVPSLAPLTVPAAPMAVAVGQVDALPAREAPGWDVTRPVLDTAGAPGPAPVVDIGDPPAVVAPALPEAPSAAGPTLPTLLGVELPVLADLTLPDVRVSVPLRAFADLENGFAFDAERYTSAQMDLIQSHVARVLNAGMGIPESVWEAIWSRAAGQLARQFITRERQGRRAHAARGWTMPGHALLAAQELAAQEINEQISAKATEQAAQRAIQEREDFWKAMQQGVALESLLVQAQTQFLELELRGAVAEQEAEVAVFNARLAGYTQDLAAVSVTLEERKVQLQAALSRLEIDRLRLEAAKVRGEVDRNAIALYTAQWEGVRAAVEVYKGRLQAMEAQMNVQRLGLDAHRLKLEDKNAQLDAWAKEWQGFATKIQAQQAIAGVYSTDAQVFGQRVQAYQALVQADVARNAAQVAAGNLRLEASRTDIARYSAEWERARAESQAYRDAVAGATLTIEGQKLELERYAQALRERETAINAWAKEWDGFATKIQAQQAIAGVYKIDAEVFGQLTSAYQVLTQTDVARADSQVKVAQLGIEASRADIERYTAQWEQARAQSQGYRDALAGATLAIDGQKLLLEGHAAQIQTQDLALRAWTQEWDGYAKKVAAQQARAGIYEIDARVFGQLVTAYQVAVQSDAAKADVQIRQAQLRLEATKTDIERYNAQWEKARAEAQAYQLAISGKGLEIEGRKLVLDAHRMDLQEQELALKAWSEQWQGYTAKMQAQQAVTGLYETDARVYGQIVSAFQAATQADAARSDAQVRAAQLGIEAAKTDIERYNAQWRTADANSQAYRDLIAGKTLEIESQKLALTGHELKLKARESEVSAWAQEWQGFATKIQAQQAVAGIYKIDAEVFGQLTSAYQAAVQADASRADVQIRGGQLTLEQAKTDISRYSAQWEKARAQSQAYQDAIRAAELDIAAQKLVLDAHGMKLKDKELAVQTWAQEWAGFETKIKAQQAIAGLYQIDAEVFGKLVAAYQTTVQADAARSDAEVKAATLRIEAARADIGRYSAQWEQARAEAQGYQSAIQAAQLSIESQKLMLTGHEMELKDKEIEVETWAKQWQGYGEKVKGQTAIAGMYEAEVRAFGERVKGVATQIEAEKVRVEAEASIVKSQVETNMADINRYKAEWEAVSSKLDALSKVYSAQTGLFGAKVQGESVRVSSGMEQLRGLIEEAKLKQGAAIAYASLASEEVLRIAALQTTSLASIGQMYSQLVSSAYAAGHVSLGNTFSTSRSTSCTTKIEG